MTETEINISENGPLLIKGPIKVTDHEGNDVACKEGMNAFCRCGSSANKPFCDGAHSKTDFDGSLA